ncbi:diguanylate cyclase [Thalassospira sp. MA62]|nr:diguanylate cyclase [Thalassospira sp. MA62]
MILRRTKTEQKRTGSGWVVEPTATQADGDEAGTGNRYKRLLSSLAEGVVVHNEVGEVVEFNDAALEILGLAPDELIGAKALDPRWRCVREDGSPFPGCDHPAEHVIATHQSQYNVVMGVGQVNSKELCWIRINAEPLFNKGTGSFEGVIASFSDINSLKKAEVAIQERERLYRQMFKNTTAVNVLIDPSDGRIVDASNAAVAFYGFPDGTLIGRRISDIDIRGEDFVRENIQKVLEHGAATLEACHRLANGDVRDILVHAGLIDLEERKYIHTITFDVTERNLYENQLREANRKLNSEQERLNEIILATNVGTWEWNLLTDEIRFNERSAEIVGYRLNELQDGGVAAWQALCHPEDFRKAKKALKRVLEGLDEYYQSEYRMRHKEGHWVWVHDRGKVVEWDGRGNPLRMSGTNSDITPSKTVEEEIRKLAQTDQLTGLSNRYQFNSMMSQVVKLNQRMDKNIVLMLLDLDRFKEVNDTYGHPVGDKLLVKVAGIIQRNCREADVVARLGGDEFAVILPMIDDVRDAAIPARRIIEEVSQPHLIAGNEVHVGISIGVSTCAQRTMDPEEIYRDADKALYRAKQCGRNRYCYYHDGLGEECSSVDKALCGRLVANSKCGGVAEGTE